MLGMQSKLSFALPR